MMAAAFLVPWRLEAAWRWWVSELALMLPAALRTRLAARRAPIVVDVDPDTVIVMFAGKSVQIPWTRLREASPDGVPGLQSVPRDRPALLRLPAGQVLRRTLTLPRNARGNLSEILRFEVERLSPLDPANIRWDWVLTDRGSSDALEVEIWVIKNDVFERALSISRTLGLIPGALTVIDDTSGTHIRRLFASMDHRLGRIATPALAVLAAVLGLLLIHTERAQGQAGIDQLQARVARAKTAAQGVDRLREQVRQSADRTGFMAQRKQEPWTLAVIAEVTRLLPDNAWLTQLQINGREVRIQGIAPRASALIEVFGQSFANARFRAPVTREPRGELERFDLSFERRGGT